MNFPEDDASPVLPGRRRAVDPSGSVSETPSFLDSAFGAPTGDAGVGGDGSALTAEPAGHASTACPSCGASASLDWAFCESCGGRMGQVPAASASGPILTPATAQATPMWTLPIASGAGPVAASSPSPQSLDTHGSTGSQGPTAPATRIISSRPVTVIEPRSRRRLPEASQLIIGAAILALVVAGGAGWFEWHSSQNELHAIESTLATTRATLADTSADLTSTRDDLSTTETDLSTAQSQLTETKSDLDDAVKELRGVRGNLNDAEDRMDLQASQIDTLQTCLGGVLDALTYSANGAYGAAVDALNSVQDECQEAGNIL